MTSYLIKEHLISNKDYYKDLYQFEITIRQGLKKQNDVVFHSDIDKQRDENFISIIVNNVSDALAIDTESVIIVLEDINLKEYLK